MRQLFLLALCVGFLAINVAGSARAAPLIAGCCDSITSEPSYLDLVWDVYGWPPGPGPWDHNLGVDASSSRAGLSRLETYLATEDPDAVIVLAGTPDTFFGPNWGPPEGYVQAVTVGNIADMIEATLADGGEPILVAPPPVFEPCDGSEDPSCAAIDERLADLSVALEALAAFEDVAFVNLYALFSAHPDMLSLYAPDGVHPSHDFGDPFITDALLPEFAALFCGNGSLDPGEECDDGNNNPGDGCSASCGAEECLDGLDNDGDGFTDYPDDPGCDNYDDVSERSPDLVCDDGYSNDGDSLVDYPADPGCFGPASNAEDPACQDGDDNDSDGGIDFDGGLSALGYVAAAPDAACTYAWYASEIPLVGDVPMCKSKRGKEITVLVPLSRVQRLLDKGFARGECFNPTNGRVLCKTKRGKRVNILVPDSRVQRALDKGCTLGECGTL